MDDLEYSISSASVYSIVGKSWGWISPNTEILIFTLCGVIGTMTEVLGYWPDMKLEELSQQDGLESQLNGFIDKVFGGIEILRMYTVHFYLATYFLLPYPVLTERQKLLLTPWLLCSLLHSLLLNLLIGLAGIVLCSSHQRLHYPCLQYSARYGAQFCVAVYFWTSVHSYYHYLDQKSDIDIGKVLKTIHKAGIRTVSNDSSRSSALLSINSEVYEEDWTESTLVERAAMAWIAREILESGGDYINDSQFSQYLALKATMELRLIVKELADIKRAARKANRERNVKERIRDTLEFSRKASSNIMNPPAIPQSGLEAFEQSVQLSRRDPIRRIPPLTSLGKPFVDVFKDLEESPLSTESLPVITREESTMVQTDPVAPQLAELFDILDPATQEQNTRVSRENSKVNKQLNKTRTNKSGTNSQN